MKLKWYISILILFLTILGIGQHQIIVPNQEIVVHFDDDDVTSEETQKTIAIVIKQLQIAGADNIIVNEGNDGRLKILYYSDFEVTKIKNILSQQSQLEFGIENSQDENDSNSPFEGNQSAYNLDFYEIQKESYTDWDFNGTNILELKPEGNRFSKPKVYTTINGIDFKEAYSNVSYNIHYAFAIAIDNTLIKIPEVRAGPEA